MAELSTAAFRAIIWEYYRQHARPMPWRTQPTHYHAVISEVMLQQTQVSRVLDKFPQFMAAFPDFESLAAAPTNQLLKVWQGMGYNRRALWLQRLAQIVTKDYGGTLPNDPQDLQKLPGIGPNTAGSIVAFAFNQPTVFIETNIRRVFIHHFFHNHDEVHDRDILPLVERTLDREHPREWYYALMDYGAHLAKTIPNPNRRSRHHTVQAKFEGSNRQLRGRLLRYFLEHRAATFSQIKSEFIDIDAGRLRAILTQYVNENFIKQSRSQYSLVD
jgi:A/G-specific adenine glycosylase